jgi:hypothetical protein
MPSLSKKQLMQKAKQNDQAFRSKEAQLVQRMKAEGFAMPAEFQNWALYFMNRNSYLQAFTTWLYKKISLHGGKPFIETDMTPHASLVKKIQERRGDASTQSKGRNSRQIWSEEQWRSRKPSGPHIPAPSGDAGSEWLCI